MLTAPRTPLHRSSGSQRGPFLKGEGGSLIIDSQVLLLGLKCSKGQLADFLRLQICCLFSEAPGCFSWISLHTQEVGEGRGCFSGSW